jgi:hypothetical protein
MDKPLLLDFVGVMHFCLKWNNIPLFGDIVHPSPNHQLKKGIQSYNEQHFVELEILHLLI